MLASDLKCKENRGTTDTNLEKILEYLLTGAAVASAIANGVKAVEFAQKEWDLAKRYWRITQNWMDYYQNSYAPVEDQEVREALALTDEEPIYETARGRSRTVAWIQFRGVLRDATRCMSRYCTGLRNDMLAELTAAQVGAVAMADGLGYRNERAYIEARSDERFKRQFETIKRGRNMVAQSVSFARASAGIYGSLFEQSWTGLMNAGQFMGYFFNRNQTAYPNTYMQGRPAFQREANGDNGVAVQQDVQRSDWAARAKVELLAREVVANHTGD